MLDQQALDDIIRRVIRGAQPERNTGAHHPVRVRRPELCRLAQR